MALKKDIELDNGIVVSYHRIVSINKITNVSVLIEVASYINETQREKEKKAIEEGTSMNIFIDTNILNKDYDEINEIDSYYAYLKTTDKFKDAEDV